VTPKPITAREAAVEVLRGAGEPLKSAEIARRVMEVKGVKLAGKTPPATVSAMLAVENKKPEGLFVRAAPGTYAMRERPVTPVTRAIGYVRVSTGEQGESGLGLKAQVAAIRAACEQRGWELVAIREEVKSGARADNRPVLTEVIRALRSGEADAVVVAKLDRLSRSVVDAGRLLEQARTGGFNIVALDLGLDLSTPTGELVANVLAAVAQWERRMIGVRTSEALQVKIAGGWKSAAWELKVPLAVRRRILRMAEAAMSQRAIAEQLNAEGVPAVGESWHRGTVIRILRQATA